MAARCHLQFDPTGNGAIQSAVPENPTIEPKTKWIGWGIAEIMAVWNFPKCVNGPWGRSFGHQYSYFLHWYHIQTIEYRVLTCEFLFSYTAVLADCDIVLLMRCVLVSHVVYYSSAAVLCASTWHPTQYRSFRWRLPPKWPILCRVSVGALNSTQSNPTIPQKYSAHIPTVVLSSLSQSESFMYSFLH